MSHIFSTLPHQPDSDRLKAISEHPKFSFRIQEINFNHGEVNEYHARHNTYYILYMRDPESRTIESNSAWSAYYGIREKKDLYLPNSAESCDRRLLTSIFANLPNLRSISVSLMRCPFEDSHPELLKNLWAMPSTRSLPRVATTERFTNILSAVASNSSTISLKSLSHDRLPFEFFIQKETLMSQFSTTFESLTSLSLAIEYSNMPNNLHAEQAFDGLSSLLRSASSLRSLNLTFQGQRKVNISHLLASLKSNDHVFLNLQQLTLKGVITTEVGLAGFVLRQKNSLKSLQLGGLGVKARHSPPCGGVHLITGSFKGLFERINRDMKLEIFKLQGDIIGFENGEKWVLDQVEDQERLWEYVID